MREWLDDPAFAERPVVAAASTIILPIHPDKERLITPPVAPDEIGPDGQNYAGEAADRFARLGKAVETLPVATFVAAADIIGWRTITADMPAPSTGLLTLVWLLGTFAHAEIHAFGFTFEGWHGHAWDRERAFFAATAATGRLTLVPSASA